MNLIKKTLCFLVLLVVTITLIVWAFTQSIKPEILKELLTKQLTSLTAQKSRINGKITWQLLPRPGIKVTQIQIGEDNNQSNYVIAIHDLVLSLQIPPLFRGNLIFNDLKIDGFQIHINPEATSSPENVKIVKIDKAFNKISEAQLAIENILLTHGQLIITRSQEQITFNDLQIGAKEFNLHNHFFPIQLKANISASLAKQKIKTYINFKGRTRLTNLLFTHSLPALQNLMVDGQLLAQDLQFNQFKMTKITANVSTKINQLILNPLNISLYNGKSVGDLNYQYNSKKLVINQTGTGLNANELCQDLLRDSLLEGNLDFSFHASADLNEQEWKNYIQANGNLSIKDGVLYFIDTHQLIKNVTHKIHNLLAQEKFDITLFLPTHEVNTSETRKGQTKFQLINLQFQMLKNWVLTDTLLLQSDQLQLKGNGKINLNDFSIDNNLSAKIVTSDQILATIQQMLNGFFPLRLKGKLNNPQIFPDNEKINPVISTLFVKKSLIQPVKQLKNELTNLLDELS